MIGKFFFMLENHLSKNQIRNYNHLNNTNINNIDMVYNNLYNKKISVSKDKNVQKRKFKTPVKK